MPARIAICLFEDKITTFDYPELITGDVTKIPLKISDSNAAVFLKKSTSSTPEWTEIVDRFAKFDDADAETASSGAILLLKISDKVIGCCFGSTVGNIKRDNIISDFGLAVAYKRIPKQSYKGIETYALLENAIVNNRSAAIPTSQNAFNLDEFLETITELSGKYYQSAKPVLVKGKEFFSITAPLSFNEIKKLCNDLIKDYYITIEDTDYKRLTGIAKVKEKTLMDYLNDKLCERINKRSPDVYLIDFSPVDIESYSFSPKGEKFTDIEMVNLFNEIRAGKVVTVDYLKTKRISVFGTDGQLLEEWSIFKCLFTSIKLDSGSHILFKGVWYEVRRRFLDDLRDSLAGYEVDASDLKLLSWDGKQSEGPYNISLAKHVEGQCWDKVLYNHDDYPYGIEFCDVLQPKYVMHVKKLSSSSLNSHLLMQTLVSSQLLADDHRLKKWIINQSEKRFKSNIFLKKDLDYQATTVSYMIVLMGRHKTKSLVDILPFFSLVTFNLIVRRIERNGFDVKICAV